METNDICKILCGTHSCQISPAACYHFFGKAWLKHSACPLFHNFIIFWSWFCFSSHRIFSFIHTFFLARFPFYCTLCLTLYFLVEFSTKKKKKNLSEWQLFRACHSLGHFPKTRAHKICVVWCLSRKRICDNRSKSPANDKTDESEWKGREEEKKNTHTHTHKEQIIRFQRAVHLNIASFLSFALNN